LISNFNLVAIKNSEALIQGPLSKKMGEEKPDEELMGKRKSSPRFSTVSRTPIIILSPKVKILYYTGEKS